MNAHGAGEIVKMDALSRLLRLAHAYEDTMLDQAPSQWDHAIPHALAIHLHPRHTRSRPSGFSTWIS